MTGRAILTRPFLFTNTQNPAKAQFYIPKYTLPSSFIIVAIDCSDIMQMSFIRLEMKQGIITIVT